MSPHFPFLWAGFTSLQHTTLHTTAVQSPTINDIFLLVSSCTNCLNLFYPIRILVSTAAQNLRLHSTCHLNNKTYPLTLVHPVPVTGFTHPLQTNVCITLYMLPFIPLHFLCIHFWQLVHCIELLPMPLPQTLHGHLTAFCIIFCHSPLIITLVLFIFTLMPLFSMLSFHSLSLLIIFFSLSYHNQVICIQQA